MADLFTERILALATEEKAVRAGTPFTTRV
jgi:hypothetical protein